MKEEQAFDHILTIGILTFSRMVRMEKLDEYLLVTKEFSEYSSS
jgi:hypothetical protein